MNPNPSKRWDTKTHHPSAPALASLFPRHIFELIVADK